MAAYIRSRRIGRALLPLGILVCDGSAAAAAWGSVLFAVGRSSGPGTDWNTRDAEQLFLLQLLCCRSPSCSQFFMFDGTACLFFVVQMDFFRET